jgi:hypothetical protein
MSLEMIAFEMNEAYAHYGISTHVTPMKIIIANIVTIILMAYLMWSGIFFKITEKYFPPEVILMMMGLVLFSILVAKDAYVFILILIGIARFMYIVFTNKKYKKYKVLLEEIFDKYF